MCCCQVDLFELYHNTSLLRDCQWRYTVQCTVPCPIKILSIIILSLHTTHNIIIMSAWRTVQLKLCTDSLITNIYIDYYSYDIIESLIINNIYNKIIMINYIYH